MKKMNVHFHHNALGLLTSAPSTVLFKQGINLETDNWQWALILLHLIRKKNDMLSSGQHLGSLGDRASARKKNYLQLTPQWLPVSIHCWGSVGCLSFLYIFYF